VPVGSGFRRLQDGVSEAMRGGRDDGSLRAVALLTVDFATWQALRAGCG
jgi:hypothetical protein